MRLAIGLQKNVRRAMEEQDRDVSRVVGWLAGIAAAAVALSLPSVHFAIAYKSLDAAVGAEAEVSAQSVTRIVAEGPDLWEFESEKIVALLEERVADRGVEIRRVLNGAGLLLAETTGNIAPPVLVRSRPIYDAGRLVGTLEVRRSLRPLLWMTALFALFGGVLGAAVFFTFKIFPMAALRKALGQLAREKERAQVTLGSIADGVITTDAGGNVELMNEPAESVTGWSREEAAGRPIGEVFRVLDAETGQEIPDLIAGRQADEGAVRRNLLVRRDGTRRLIDDSVAPISGEWDRHAGTVLVFRDMTERVRREEELQKLQKLESLGNLAGGIAHDFNNCLAGILGNISLGKHALEPGSGAYVRLEEAEKATSKASELATKLLTFSKGGVPVSELIPLDGLIRTSASKAAQDSGASCAFEIADDLWAAHADAGQIRQAIDNLVRNAAEAMPQGGVVRIRAENVTIEGGGPENVKSGRYARIDVTDTGVGIPQQHLERVFDPYFTTRGNRSGLWLTIAYHIMKGHGGNLLVASEEGAGTTATMFLPASTERPAFGEEILGRALPRRKARVLVMDDEEMVREMAIGILEHLGCEPAGAKDGAEAIRMYADAMKEGKTFDLVIMDLV
ncbi:MAG: PAS domain S-box protein, partial [Deltaproteobacteria bacterium]|nr:PAS domain S-box protein [Deltaproteobacteria bacterium]